MGWIVECVKRDAMSNVPSIHVEKYAYLLSYPASGDDIRVVPVAVLNDRLGKILRISWLQKGCRLRDVTSITFIAVSYTHLTLPTIYSV